MPNSRTVTMGARPAPVVIDVRRTAVIVVDMQNDFAAVGGMFERAGIDISVIRPAIEPTRQVLGAARNAGMPVVYLKMAFKADLSDAGPLTGPTWQKHQPLQVGETVTAPDGSESRILIRHTWNTAIIDELTPGPADIEVWKHRYSGFFGTDLHDRLQALDIETLLFTGATTSVCVESTYRDASYLNYHALLIEDCCAEPIGHGLPRSNHDATLLVLQILFGSITTSAAVLTAVS